MTFEAVFLERIAAIEEDARRIGINMTVVCADAGVSRATPDRWRRLAPKTIQIVDKMEKIVEAHRLRRLAELGGIDASTWRKTGEK